MSHWNHRVIKKVYKQGTDEEDVLYGIHEVFYNDTGEIYAYTEQPIDLQCESVEALREYILWCLDAFEIPIIEDGKIEFAKDDLTDKNFKNAKNFDTIEEMLDNFRDDD